MEEITRDLVNAELADLVQDLNDWWSRPGEPVQFATLVTPQWLDVLRDFTLWQEEHYGGEEFMPVEARLDAANSIVVRFMPRDTVGYTRMEMSAAKALDDLEGFSILARTERGTYQERMREIVRKQSILRERSRMKDKFEEYKDLDFGSF